MQEPKIRALVISQQHWGTMRVTNHHYGVASGVIIQSNILENCSRNELDEKLN
jgi:hypothetical protein